MVEGTCNFCQGPLNQDRASCYIRSKSDTLHSGIVQISTRESFHILWSVHLILVSEGCKPCTPSTRHAPDHVWKDQSNIHTLCCTGTSQHQKVRMNTGRLQGRGTDAQGQFQAGCARGSPAAASLCLGAPVEPQSATCDWNTLTPCTFLAAVLQDTSRSQCLQQCSISNLGCPSAEGTGFWHTESLHTWSEVMTPSSNSVSYILRNTPCCKQASGSHAWTWSSNDDCMSPQHHP